MNESFFISVIIPVFNSSKYLIQAIDNILSQTFVYFELLLIDDGSTDNSGKICDDYALKDNRVRTFHKENGGVSSARNVGIKESSCKYITFVDADDWVDTDYLQHFVVRLKEGTDAHLSESALWIYDNENSEQMPDKGCFFFSVWGNLFVKQIIVDNNIHFNEDLYWGEDTLFCLEYLKHVATVEYMFNYTYHYRLLSSNSISCNVPLWQRLQFYSKLCEKEKEDYIQKNDDLSYVITNQKKSNMIMILTEVSLMTKAEQQKFMSQIQFDSITLETLMQLLNETDIQNKMLQKKLEQIKHSYAYRIGKIILKPISFIKLRVNNIF